MIEKHLLLDDERGAAKMMIRTIGQLMIGIMALACLCTLGVSAGCAQQPLSPTSTAANGGPQATTESSDQYLIGPGDELSIGIFGKAELSRDTRVDERGMIMMPLIDEGIRAACRTENEVAEEIARMYRDRQLLNNPTVSVSVKDYQSQPVAVLGAINAPGRFILHRRVRLLELLVFHAGGPTAKAGGKVQILSTARGIVCEGSASQNTAGNVTPAKTTDTIVTYDLKELLQGNEAMNPYVQQGDIINVPAAEEAIVVGNVLHPSTVSLVEPTTLSRALALAGGILPKTKKDKIRIIRQIPGSASTKEFLVDLKAPDRSKGEEFLLQGGDIVEVSTKTGLQAILANMANSVVPNMTGLAVRVIP
jgi:polysaccharide biosynthesis/export protein